MVKDLVWESRLHFSLPVRSNVLLCYKIDILLQFPSVMVVVESLPFAKVFHVAVDSFSVRDDVFTIVKSFEIFLLSFPFEQESFAVFLGYPWSIEPHSEKASVA